MGLMTGVRLPPCLLLLTILLLITWRLVTMNKLLPYDEALDWQTVKVWGLVTGYVTAAVMMVLYFACEGACCHNSQEHESTYQIIVLIVIMASTMFVYLLESLKKDEGGMVFMMDGWSVLMITLVSMRIARERSGPKMVDAYRNECDDGLVKALRKVREPRTSRMAAELSTSVSELLELESGALLHIPDKLYSMFLLVFMMFLEMVVHSFALRLFMHQQHGVTVVFGILFVSLGVDEWKRCVQSRPMRDHIHQTVQHLVDEAEERDDPSFLSKVLLRVNVGNLLEVSWQKTNIELTSKACSKGLLDVVSKAILVDALQKRGMSSQVRRQKAVSKIFLCTYGNELTILKNLVDSGGDYYNLYKLMSSITNHEIRVGIEKHFAEQAKLVRLRNEGKAVGTKVLSDIDDTLYSSGGRFPAGCDKAYPRHMVYPGCLKLFEVLVAGKQDNSKSSPRNSCDLVFLSARPHIYKSVAEDQSYQLFRSLVREQRMHTFPTLLPGDLVCALSALLTYPFFKPKTKAWRWVGEFKYKTFEVFTSLYPEYDFVFCGDNGQGDQLAGQLMLPKRAAGQNSDTESDRDGEHAGGTTALCVLVHEVMAHEESLALEPATERGAAWQKKLRQRGLIFHRTYVGAALGVFRLGLISDVQLEAVVQVAVEDFEWALAAFPDFEGWRCAARDLREDLGRANEVLVEYGLEAVKDDMVSKVEEAEAAEGRIRRRRTVLPVQESCSFCEDEEGSDGAEETGSDESVAMLR